MRNNQTIRFSISGTPPTNNRNTRLMRGVHVPNPQYTKYKIALINKVKDIVRNVKWQIVGNDGAVSARLICWNIGSDIDARTKVPFDVLQGILYGDDKIIRVLIVADKLDQNGPRIDFTFREIAPLQPPKRARAMRFSDLSADNLRDIINRMSVILDPSPGEIRPIILSDVPEAWLKKAQKAQERNPV